jgi:hypothetical protein
MYNKRDPQASSRQQDHGSTVMQQTLGSKQYKINNEKDAA